MNQIRSRPCLIFLMLGKEIDRMIRSMTGFGRGECRTEKAGYTVEIRTVNQRYLDCTVRMPRDILQLEDRVRQLLKESVLRGKTEVFVTPLVDGGAELRSVRANLPLIRAYAAAYRETALDTALSELGVTVAPASLDLQTLLRIPNAFGGSAEETDAEQQWAVLEPALRAALAGLVSMREAEGEKLKAALLEILDGLVQKLEVLRLRAPQVPELYRERLRARLQELGQIGADEQRIAAEVAMFADRCSIDEETARLDSHFRQFRETLEETGSVGKKLDFLLQEMNREVNTVGSKANDMEITQTVLALKCGIEKLREQIQNIE